MLVAQNSLGPVCPVPLTVRGTAAGGGLACAGMAFLRRAKAGDRASDLPEYRGLTKKYVPLSVKMMQSNANGDLCALPVSCDLGNTLDVPDSALKSPGDRNLDGPSPFFGGNEPFGAVEGQHRAPEILRDVLERCIVETGQCEGALQFSSQDPKSVGSLRATCQIASTFCTQKNKDLSRLPAHCAVRDLAGLLVTHLRDVCGIASCRPVVDIHDEAALKKLRRAKGAARIGQMSRELASGFASEAWVYLNDPRQPGISEGNVYLFLQHAKLQLDSAGQRRMALGARHGSVFFMRPDNTRDRSVSQSPFQLRLL